MNKVCQRCGLDDGDIRSEGVKDYALFNTTERLCHRCAVKAGWETPEPKAPEPKKFTSRKAVLSFNGKEIGTFTSVSISSPDGTAITVGAVQQGADIYVDGQLVPTTSDGAYKFLTKDEIDACKADAGEVWTPDPALVTLRDELHRSIQQSIAKAFRDCAGMTASEVAVAWLDHYYGARP